MFYCLWSSLKLLMLRRNHQSPLLYISWQRPAAGDTQRYIFHVSFQTAFQISLPRSKDLLVMLYLINYLPYRDNVKNSWIWNMGHYVLNPTIYLIFHNLAKLKHCSKSWIVSVGLWSHSHSKLCPLVFSVT